MWSAWTFLFVVLITPPLFLSFSPIRLLAAGPRGYESFLFAGGLDTPLFFLFPRLNLHQEPSLITSGLYEAGPVGTPFLPLFSEPLLVYLQIAFCFFLLPPISLTVSKCSPRPPQPFFFRPSAAALQLLPVPPLIINATALLVVFLSPLPSASCFRPPTRPWPYLFSYEILAFLSRPAFSSSSCPDLGFIPHPLDTLTELSHLFFFELSSGLLTKFERGFFTVPP